MGQTSATVEITLSNTGSMAYNTKIYGPKITVSRTFTENTNHYKLLNSKGTRLKLFSAYREEVISKLQEKLSQPVSKTSVDWSNI